MIVQCTDGFERKERVLDKPAKCDCSAFQVNESLFFLMILICSCSSADLDVFNRDTGSWADRLVRSKRRGVP